MPETDDRALPEPVLRPQRRGPSLIWLVPALAAAAGLTLLVRAFLAAGPSIEISFDTAEDLIAGKTEVRYKHVVIGRVQDIELAEDGGHVLVRVDLARDAAHVAVDDSQFWVARVRTDMGGVSGFKTLVTGSYIGVNVGRSKEPRREFVGLEKPPIVSSDEKGRRFRLIAADLGSLTVGSPIYFRRIPVGRVAGFELEPDGKGVRIDAFVDQPYDRFVTADARFWNASGVDLSLDANGLKLDTQSLVTLVAGGVAFEPLSGDASGKPAPDDAGFVLHSTRLEALAPQDAEPVLVRMRFSESVRGLAANASVDFMGVTLGEITDIQLSYENPRKRFVADVSARLFPRRLGPAYRELITEDGGNGIAPESVLGALVERGLRAQLRPGNLITGQLYVALDFPRTARPARFDREARPLQIPTEPASLDQIQSRIVGIVTQLDQIPFAEIGGRLRDALAAADALLDHLDTEVAPAALASLRSARAALDSANLTLARPDAPLQQDMHRTLEEVDRAARSLRELSDYLQRHPEALIRGRGGEDETAPANE